MKKKTICMQLNRSYSKIGIGDKGEADINAPLRQFAALVFKDIQKYILEHQEEYLELEKENKFNKGEKDNA